MFDTLPITDANLNTSNAVLGYARVIDLWGKSGKVDIVVPYTWLSGTANYLGEPVERVVNGFADPAVRLSVNLYGAPALTLKEFRDYRQDVIVGASLRVSVPWGQYDDTRLLNIGTNRWTFKPEIGVSKAIDQWTLEFTAAATLFTDNTDFFGGNTRSQDPLYSFQAHVIYSFHSGVWASLDGTYFTGGRTTLNGVLNADLSRTGASAARSRSPSTSTTRSSSTRTAGCRRARATITIWSGSPGSTAGAVESDREGSAAGKGIAARRCFIPSAVAPHRMEAAQRAGARSRREVR